EIGNYAEMKQVRVGDRTKVHHKSYLGDAWVGADVNIGPDPGVPQDRKSTRLNSSHLVRSYAVFCLKKKKFSVARKSGHRSDRPPAFSTRLTGFLQFQHPLIP